MFDSTRKVLLVFTMNPLGAKHEQTGLSGGNVLDSFASAKPRGIRFCSTDVHASILWTGSDNGIQSLPFQLADSKMGLLSYDSSRLPPCAEGAGGHLLDTPSALNPSVRESKRSFR